ncbi:MAG: arginase family protein [Spirochaetales bacterium]|nr:arginase family protein [Spirochaetales bacterium]MCF7939204.1 arginase family protein [Spirochaetales bacterium]
MSLKRPEHPSFFSSGTQRIEEAGIVLAGFPYDCTASFRAGARFGPRERRVYPGDGLEDFSFYFGEDLEDATFYDAGDMDPVYGDPLPVIDSYRQAAAELITAGLDSRRLQAAGLDSRRLQAEREQAGGLDPRRLQAEARRLLAIGGEHLITYPLLLAARQVYGEFTLLHLDAHADLAVVNHVGSRVAHGTVMNLCLEAGLEKLVQYGIRSGNRQEYEMRINDPRIIPAGSLEEFVDSVETGERVYLTVDVDFFDPAFVPGTGTPEAGGAGFDDFISVRRGLRKRQVQMVGADIVELAPELDASGNSTVFAGKVLRELLLTMHVLGIV